MAKSVKVKEKLTIGKNTYEKGKELKVSDEIYEANKDKLTLVVAKKQKEKE